MNKAVAALALTLTLTAACSWDPRLHNPKYQQCVQEGTTAVIQGWQANMENGTRTNPYSDRVDATTAPSERVYVSALFALWTEGRMAATHADEPTNTVGKLAPRGRAEKACSSVLE